MSRKAEQWLAEQEVALLEAICQLQSPAEPEDQRQAITVDVRKRVSNARRPGDASYPKRGRTG